MKQPTHTGHLKGNNFKYLRPHNINVSSCQSHKNLDRQAPSEYSRAKEKTVSSCAVSGRAGKTDGEPDDYRLTGFRCPIKAFGHDKMFSLSISYV